MTIQVDKQMANLKSKLAIAFLNCFLLLAIIVSAAIPAAQAEDRRPVSVPKVEVIEKSLQASPVVKAAAQSIMCMVQDMNSKQKELVSVKVPSYNYAGILQELQNHNAKFLLPGAEAPASAKAVFQLEAEHAGLSQTVYFL